MNALNEYSDIESDCLAEDVPHPRFTKHLYGQSAAEDVFLSAVRSQRILHAWLVSGPRGCGKATLAWRICKFLMVRAHKIHHGEENGNPSSLDVDPEHPVARRIKALTEPSLSLVRRPYDADRKRIKTQITVTEIRQLGDQFALSPADGQPLIAIIDAADDMNNFAANALLKLLEEPPDHAFMFLISHSPDQLLPTIRSRCGFLHCQPLDRENLTRAVEGAGFSLGEDAEATSELAGGSAGMAIQLQANEGLEIYRNLISIAKMMPNLAWHKAFKFASDCAIRGSEIQYNTSLMSILMLVSRITKVSVGLDLGQAVEGEQECLSRLSKLATPQRWTELQLRLSEQSEHAKQVNLDSVSVVLDMLLSINGLITSNDRAR